MARGNPGQKRKPGGGRKPSLVTQLRSEFIAGKEQEAEFAFAYIDEILRGYQKFDFGKFSSAIEIMNRIWGKPSQSVRVFTWQDEIVQLIKDKKVTHDSIVMNFGSDLAAELFAMAGISVST